ncbi:MAG: hypothetical protein K8R49_06835 [Candidatus Cloacimonetes bacterium]|nr:hypothetical protein [Candidatus Cloacimonadota bacterium]
MSFLNKISYFQNRKDAVPNQELAKELTETKNKKGIREIAENLWNENKNIQSDCIKVLYEIGYIDPKLIGNYTEDFLKLIESRINRLVWGGMIALSTIAKLKADKLFPHFEEIKKVIENGSVITVDSGILTLSKIASAKMEYNERIFPYLLELLKTCRPKSVAMYSEFVFDAVNEKNRTGFIEVLNKRKEYLNPNQVKRVEKLLGKF